MSQQDSLLTGNASDFLKIGVAASGRGDLETLEAVLSERPQWILRVGSHGRTMLWEAAYRGSLDVVEYLLDRGADIEARGCHFTPLLVEISPYCAARVKKHERVASTLLDRGARLDVYTKAYLGDIEGVRQEIDNDPLLVSSELPQHDSNLKVTVLHYAVASRQQRIVDLLLGRGAAVTPYSDWLVRFAIWRDDPQILQALIDAGADVMRSDPPRSGVSNPQIRAILREAGVEENPDYSEGGWPPIVFLSRGDRGGNVQRIQDLIDRGANVNNVNYKGQTALHCASKAGFIEIVRLLMQHGATVNAVDKNGETPLIAALTSTIKDHERLSEVILLLVNNGADLKHADRRGRTAVSIASRKKGGTWTDLLHP